MSEIDCFSQPIFLLKDFPHQARGTLFGLWEVTIVFTVGLGIKMERTDIVGIEGNDEGCRPPRPTRASWEGSVLRYLSAVSVGSGAKAPPGRKRIGFILSVTERAQGMHNAVFKLIGTL